MIKLIDLLKELDLRSGELSESFANDTNLYISFFNDFKFEGADMASELSSEELDVIFDGEVNQSEVGGTVLLEVDNYKFLDPAIGMNKYLVKTDAKTWREYIVGYVEIEIRKNKPYKLKGGQLSLTYISKMYRGKGMGTLLYYMALAHYQTLFSDEILYEGSRRIWIGNIYDFAGFFGMQVLDFYVPLTLEDASNDDLMDSGAILSYVASTKPSPEMIKMDKFIGGLSLTKGEYGIYEYPKKTSAFYDLVEEFETLSDLVDSQEFVTLFDANDYPKALIVRTADTVCVVKKAGKRLDIEDVELI